MARGGRCCLADGETTVVVVHWLLYIDVGRATGKTGETNDDRQNNNEGGGGEDATIIRIGLVRACIVLQYNYR